MQKWGKRCRGQTFPQWRSNTAGYKYKFSHLNKKKEAKVPLCKNLKYISKKNYSANGTVGTSFSLLLFIISLSIIESLFELPDTIAKDILVTIKPVAK